MSTLPLPLTTLTSNTIDNNNLSYTMIIGINSLPAELLLQILSLSFVSGSRKESYKILMLVCRRFVGKFLSISLSLFHSVTYSNDCNFIK